MRYRPLWTTLAVLLALLFPPFAIAENEPFDTPPTFDKGWNMISSPCDISVSDLKQKLGTEELEVHRWNGAGYEQTDNLKRGEGYFVNVNAVLNSSSICDAEEIRETTTISYIEGWNLIGNPYRKSLSFEELFGGSINDIGDSIYELRGNKFVAIAKQDHAKPWRGYWVYAKKDVTLSIQPSIVLTIYAYRTKKLSEEPVGDSVNILVGEKLYFVAVAKYAGEDEPDESPDVTWRTSNEKAVVKGGDGPFTGIAEGGAEITAEFEGAKSNTITVTVTKYPEADCKRIVVAFSSGYRNYYESYHNKSEITNINAQQCTTYGNSQNFRCWNIKDSRELAWHDENAGVVIRAFCGDTAHSKEITDLVTWNISDSSVIGHVEKERFKSVSSGHAVITAKFKERISNELYVIVEKVKLNAITLNRDYRGKDSKYCTFSACTGISGLLLKGGTAGFEATGIFGNKYINNSYSKNISDSVSWSLSDVDLADINSTGLLTALEKGIVSVTAEKENIKSAPYPVRIVEKGELITVLISPNKNVTLNTGETTTLTAHAYFFDEVSKCGDGTDVCGRFTEEDVTQEVEWTLSNTSVGSIEKGVFTALESAGTTSVQAEYGGMKSNSVKVTVRKLNLQWLEINPVDYANLVNISFSTNVILKGKTTKIKATGYYSYDSSEGCNVYDNDVFLGFDVDVDIYNCDYWNYIVTDVTSTVVWKFSEPGIVSIDESGNLTALKSGAVTITATKEGKTSDSITLRVVEENEILSLRLAPTAGIKVPPGGAANVTATAYYMSSESKDCKVNGYPVYYSDNHYFNECYLKAVDVTGKATWALLNSSIGTLENGVFTAGKSNGESTMTAAYQGMNSNMIDITVRNIIWIFLTIKPINAKYLPGCLTNDCFYTRFGNKASFSAQAAEYGDPAWRYNDLTSSASWEISDTSIAEISGGVLTPKSRGLVWIRASVGGAKSNKVWVAVMDSVKHDFLLIAGHDSKSIKSFKVGEYYGFNALYYSYDPAGYDTCGTYYFYDCIKPFNVLDVSSSSLWNVSDSKIGSFSSDGNFTGISPGFADVSASYKNLTSNTLAVEVWDFRNMPHCDSSNINIAELNDRDAKATLETDCRVYSYGENVNIKYTAFMPDNWKVFDKCLDLYVLDDKDNIVKTFREEGCSSEPLGRAAARAMTPVYQFLSTWDMKDNSGKQVPTGTYYAVARFYIQRWDPVLRLPFEIIEKY